MSNQRQTVDASRELPRAVAHARGVTMTPRKVRRVVDLVRGKKADEALAILRFDPHAASTPIYKCLASAMANAENNLDLDPDTLWISTVYVDEASKRRRRIVRRAQGRGYLMKKRDSHITVEVESRPKADAAKKGRRSDAKARTKGGPR